MGLLQCQSVGKRFAGLGRSVEALADVNLEVSAQSFMSLVGPSGCGKSTLLQLLGGLIEPTSGEIWYGDQRVVGKPVRGIVYLFQQYSLSLFPWRTVLGNVAFGPENEPGYKKKKNEVRELCMEYLTRVGLSGFEHQYPWQLSGGMQQRVAIARALVFRPRVLLMDEPFSAVDALTRQELQDLVLDLWRDFDLTIVFVTHDIDEAIFMAERVHLMGGSPGGIVESTDVRLPYPRDQLHTRQTDDYLRLRAHLYNQIFALKNNEAELERSH